jgi:hypothetical protein
MESMPSIAVAESRSAEPPAALAFLPLTILTAVVLVLAALFADASGVLRAGFGSGAFGVLLAFCAAWRHEATTLH